MSAHAPRYTATDIARAGLFGAAALVFPLLFHVLHLGKLFLPMYIPLVALAFLTRPAVAGAAGLLTPLVSALATGMPPWYPPIAPIMAAELGVMCAAIAWAHRRRPRLNLWLLLGAALVGGRVLGAALTYLAAALMELPAPFVASISFLAGWPGVVLMMAVIPPFVRLVTLRR